MSTYPIKIAQQPNGVYTWSCPIEAEYYRSSIRPGLYACIGIAVFLLIFGGVLSYQYNDVKSFFIVAGCAAVFLLISFLIFGLALSATDPHESYELTEDFVKSGYGKSSVYFDFKKVRVMVLSAKYIELHGKTKRMRIYVPEEDYNFVRSYIQSRVPMESEVRYG